MNAVARLALLPLIVLALSMFTSIASAFQLGDIKFTNGSDRFEFRIPVLELQRDATSKLTGTIYSQSEVVDSFRYGIENAGEALEFVASADQPVSESFVFVVEMNYRGQVTGRRYEFKLDGTQDNNPPQDATNFSMTPGNIERYVPKAKFDLNLKHTTHIVKPGQSLWDIAVDCEEIGGNNFQRSLAIFAANQKQFVNGDINHLSVDTTLVIPKQAYVDMFSPTEATSVFYKLATGRLAIDATYDEASSTETASSSNAASDTQQVNAPAVEMSASREIPTEQAMLARRIDGVESNIRTLLEEHTTRMREALSDLDQRIEVLETR